MRKKGWIIFNGNLYTKKFSEQIEWLQNTARTFDFDIDVIANNQLLVAIEEGQARILTEKQEPDFVFFWDKDLFLARQLEDQGLRLFNPAKAIEICDDKALTYQQLANQGIRMPKTIIAPKVFVSLEEDSHLTQVIEILGFPMVIKETFGSFGEQVYLIDNEQQLRQKVKELQHKPHLFQEYIASSYGRDVRLNVIGDRVVAAMLRKSDQDFRANVTTGGKMYRYQPTEEEQAMAVRCSQLVGADFAGVDLLFGENDEPILCEINSNAHFKNIYDCTGIDITQNMMSYIKETIS
ncbi:gamma-F420-2:alpha-L-glutamate ligase [Gracilibacillus orientalis]|uniref:Gamma-F420-2:alpha-L-glutamate ligase n=1 Tax=Gracilibacillus orientalis TaxID=334253 RepID=A0A1I4Q0F5_9BACI|nr:RimK family alpha-L-glutamate ligase [Gracilibacillus orientalis]SFM33558.1 gamma-F420-2:alpha-L-glutamate ligase [Gracilibacillus orientalis]SFM49329.1 gamma-F420-2:alpha-L-glutamate ligase [Gracilibacillus orientalis]